MEYKRLNDKISLNIICPGCQKSTKYYQLNQYPRDAELEEHIKNDNDLVMPTEWTEVSYTETMKNLRPEQREQKMIINPLLYHIDNHYELCKYSDRDVIFFEYCMLRHEEKTAGITFRILESLPQRSP